MDFRNTGIIIANLLEIVSNRAIKGKAQQAVTAIIFPFTLTRMFNEIMRIISKY